MSSTTPGVADTLSRVGIALVLHLRDREQPLFGDVVGALDCDDTFEFEVWGVGVRTIELSNVKSATSPDLGFREYREIRSRQRLEAVENDGEVHMRLGLGLSTPPKTTQMTPDPEEQPQPPAQNEPSSSPEKTQSVPGAAPLGGGIGEFVND